jgi:hypothetical protein
MSSARGRPNAPIPIYVKKSPSKDVFAGWAFTVKVDGVEVDVSECRFEAADGANLLRLVAPVCRGRSKLQTWSVARDPRQVTIVAGNGAGRPVGEYRIRDAEPRKYSLAWDIGSNKNLCEHLTLTFKDYSPEESNT